MSEGKRRYTDRVPEEFELRLRKICLALPEVYEERAWVGTRWQVRNRTFAHVLGIDQGDAEPIVVLSFRATGDELEMLRHAGHPFFVLGWGRDAIGMVLDETTDFAEVSELLTESYCVLAPKKLIALVNRPASEG
jgi:YjbR